MFDLIVSYGLLRINASVLYHQCLGKVLLLPKIHVRSNFDRKQVANKKMYIFHGINIAEFHR